MSFCFVIQPIDEANTKRFDDVFEPAIRAAGLDEAYRVDRDPAATVLIDKIEERIRAADACLADISTDNPNVWFELGYALALGKVVVMVCAEGRERFPFDIQHRYVIKYKSESKSDFDRLRDEITERLKTQLESRAAIEDVAARPVAAPQAGLNPQQLAALVTVAAQHLEGGMSAYQLRQEMGSVGFTEIATTIAVRGLERMAFVESYSDSDYNGQEFTAYRATEKGLDWLEENQDKLALRYQPSTQAARSNSEIDDLPF